ncbi:hypothetical protein BH18ACT12_BH18ACT12_16230 [soil metagenome]
MGNLVDLATRRAGGIEVALIWDREERTLVVFAHDVLTSEEVSIPVSEDEATEVYLHPFVYAHRVRAKPPGPARKEPAERRAPPSAPSDRTG